MSCRTHYGRDVQEREADERYDRLMVDLKSTCKLLMRYGERHWSDWMDSVRREIEAHDAHGLTRLLQAYGGMGSFNDVYLHPPDAQGGRATESRDNDLLEELRSQIWADATALLKALDRDA